MINAKLDALNEFRRVNNIPEYKQNDAQSGTIAMTEAEGKKHFGANSTLKDKTGNLVRKLPKSEVDTWIERLILAGKIKNAGEGEFLYHAEAEALINAHNAGVKFPESAVLFVDRPTCAKACKKHLGALLSQLGIKKLYIYWINATEAPSTIINAH
ncbi:MAG: hypothetical protein HC896_07775 [Bacteroidales bacterium]|nr:hypothetical protein [Bacteroidales bacterium]